MPDENDILALRVRIEGRVQGAWFRAWTCEEAQGLGLDGFVRNRKDGSVEALFKGPRAAVDAMVERCREGPPNAHVTTIETHPADGVTPKGFRKLPTV